MPDGDIEIITKSDIMENLKKRLHRDKRLMDYPEAYFFWEHNDDPKIKEHYPEFLKFWDDYKKETSIYRRRVQFL